MTLANYAENRDIVVRNSFGKATAISTKKSVPISRRFSLGWLMLLLLVLCCSLPTAAQTDQAIDNSDWIGSYYFSETAPAMKRGSSRDIVPSASYEITIEEKDHDLTASFAANGVQLFEAYECSVIAKDDTLEFYFQNLGSAEVQNFRRFRKGDLLFRLSKSGGKNVKYLFQPAAYKIIRVNPSKQKTPVYFEKPPV